VKSAFLDTSGLIAVVNTDDQWHKRAERAWEKLFSTNATPNTSSLVLVEIADGLSQIKRRPLAIQLMSSLSLLNPSPIAAITS
jgi:predicted nucleic acid-binding protein